MRPRHRARPELKPTDSCSQSVPNPHMILRPRPAAKPADSPHETPTAKAGSAEAPQLIFNQGLPGLRDGAREPVSGLEQRPRAGRDCARNIQDGRRWLSSRPATWRSRPEAVTTAKRARPAIQPRPLPPRPKAMAILVVHGSEKPNTQLQQRARLARAGLCPDRDDRDRLLQAMGRLLI